MDEKNNRKNIYLADRIVRKASCRCAILSFNIFPFIYLFYENKKNKFHQKSFSARLFLHIKRKQEKLRNLWFINFYTEFLYLCSFWIFFCIYFFTFKLATRIELCFDLIEVVCIVFFAFEIEYFGAGRWRYCRLRKRLEFSNFRIRSDHLHSLLILGKKRALRNHC